MNDTQRVMSLFRASKGRMITNHEIIRGQFYGVKPVLEYTGRISDVRKIFECSCGQDKDTCTASEHIISIGDNKFVYKSQQTEEIKRQSEVVPVAIDLNKSKTELIKLRSQYRSMKENDPMRGIVGARGKAVRKAIDMEMDRRKLEEDIKAGFYEVRVQMEDGHEGMREVVD